MLPQRCCHFYDLSVDLAPTAVATAAGVFALCGVWLGGRLDRRSARGAILSDLETPNALPIDSAVRSVLVARVDDKLALTYDAPAEQAQFSAATVVRRRKVSVLAGALAGGLFGVGVARAVNDEASVIECEGWPNLGGLAKSSARKTGCEDLAILSAVSRRARSELRSRSGLYPYSIGVSSMCVIDCRQRRRGAYVCDRHRSLKQLSFGEE